MTDANRTLFERAQRVIPGGVNSPVRAFGSVGGTPYFVDRSDGPYVWDADGRRYIDYVQSYGPGILGHAHPAVLEAISVAASRGTSFGAPTEAEVVMAEMVVERIAGLESVRFVSSGTEATMSAIRLARGATGRPGIVKFAGCYHGHGDALLAAGGSGVANQGLTGCDGVTAGAVADTIVAPYNVVPELDGTVAAVIVEPVAANMGLVAPVPGFLEGLRAACDAAGSLLVFDEVITGFRLARGGAAERFGVTPDLWCFGKVIGGGLPVGAFGGRWEVMEHLAPLGGVYQGGTLSGNPLAMAAGRATLELLDDGAFDRLPAWPMGWRSPSTAPGSRPCCPGWARCWGAFSATWPPPTSTRRRCWPTTASTRRSSTPSSSGAWRWPQGPTRRSSPASPTRTRS